MTQHAIVVVKVHKTWMFALILGLTLGCKSGTEKQRTPGCQPEGGIQCEGSVLSLCKDGKLAAAGPCPGGCVTRGREARCYDKDKTLIAPVGTACQQGMALCGMTTKTLLVCKNNKLALAGPCPGGCDRGDGSMLYCFDENNDLRFAEGMGCSGLGKSFELACGMDGKQVLICRNEYYERYAANCHKCAQQYNGQLTCVNELLDPIEIAPESAPVAVPEG